MEHYLYLSVLFIAISVTFFVIGMGLFFLGDSLFLPEGTTQTRIKITSIILCFMSVIFSLGFMFDHYV